MTLVWWLPHGVDFFPWTLEHAGIKIAGRNINNLTTLMAESEEQLKSLLMNVKEESEKVGLKLNIQRSSSFRSWHPVLSLHGKQMGKQWKWRDFIFLGSEITAGGDCSHEIKRCLLLGRKAMTDLDNIKKQRHYFANKGYGFSSGPVWM